MFVTRELFKLIMVCERVTLHVLLLTSSSLVPRNSKQLACEHTFDTQTNQSELVTSNHLHCKFLHTKQVVSL